MLERGDALVSIEAKFGATMSPAFLQPLPRLAESIGEASRTPPDGLKDPLARTSAGTDDVPRFDALGSAEGAPFVQPPLLGPAARFLGESNSPLRYLLRRARCRALRMTSIGAGCPVHSSKAAAPWCNSMPEPSTPRRRA